LNPTIIPRRRMSRLNTQGAGHWRGPLMVAKLIRLRSVRPRVFGRILPCKIFVFYSSRHHVATIRNRSTDGSELSKIAVATPFRRMFTCLSSCDNGHSAIVFRRYTVSCIARSRAKIAEMACSSSMSDGPLSDSHGLIDHGLMDPEAVSSGFSRSRR